MAFSARVQGGGIHYDFAELSRREKEANIKPDSDIDYMKAVATGGQEANLITDYVLREIRNRGVVEDKLLVERLEDMLKGTS